MDKNIRLKSARLSIGLNQLDFGIPLGLSQANVRDLESGKVKISTLHALAIEKIYRISPEWLMDGKGPMILGEAEYSLSESEKNGDKIGEVPGGDLEEGKDNKKADRSPVKAAAVSYIDAMTDYEASGVINYILSRQAPQRNQRTQQAEYNQFDFIKHLSVEGKKELLAVLDKRIEQAVENESLSDTQIERHLNGN